LSSPNISDRSYLMTADFDADENVQGVILAWGSRFGGFVLYVKDGQLHYEYVYSESLKHATAVAFPQRPGKRVIQLKFERGQGHASRASLFVDGAAAGAMDIPRTWPTHGTTAGLNCGRDAGAPVSDAYERPFRFTGRSLRVTVELEPEQSRNPDAAFGVVLREQ
jgi:hypothetical protein